MQEILKFKDSSIEFSLLIDDSSKLVYKKSESGNISYQLTSQEKQLINQVFYQLFPSKRIKDLGLIKYNGKEINHFYDFDRYFHIFLEKESVTEDCLLLNAIFNNQEEYVALRNKRNYNEKYIKRRIKIGKRVVSVVLSSAFFLTLSLFYIKGVKKIVALVDNYKYQAKVEEYQDRKVQLEEIINTINSNSNLTEEEKEFFLSCPAFFEENLEYFDYYTVLDHLKRLRVEYIKEVYEPGKYGEFVNTGEERGLIKIYNSTCFFDASKSALSHEFLHAFTKVSANSNYISEGLNVLFNNEYFGSLAGHTLYDNGYDCLRGYMYLLCEILPKDVLRSYQANNDIHLLVQSLMQIIPDENLAVELLINIDFVCRGELLQNTNREAYFNLKEEIKIKEKKIKETLKVYYETKYQTSALDDNYFFFWLDASPASCKMASELGLDFQAIRYADEFTRVKQYKKVFHEANDSPLILSICNEVKEVQRYYTLEEVLNGNTGILYKSQEEIDLPLMKNGMYLGVAYEPLTYMDYEVLSYMDTLKVSKKN